MTQMHSIDYEIGYARLATEKERIASLAQQAEAIAEAIVYAVDLHPQAVTLATGLRKREAWLVKRMKVTAKLAQRAKPEEQ